jgi:hypothetical protein
MNETDRELLELAAKAAGLGFTVPVFGVPPFMGLRLIGGALWNPLIDDGDALRLAVKLKMCVGVVPSNIKDGHATVALAPANPVEIGEAHADDPYAATRRAIVRAAAEIGRTMK